MCDKTVRISRSWKNTKYRHKFCWIFLRVYFFGKMPLRVKSVAPVWMRHVTYECVMSHIWMCHVTHMNASCRTYECVMSHIWMRHVAHMNMSCHTHTHTHIKHKMTSQILLSIFFLCLTLKGFFKVKHRKKHTSSHRKRFSNLKSSCHILICHVTHTGKMQLEYERNSCYKWMFHVTHMNEMQLDIRSISLVYTNFWLIYF